MIHATLEAYIFCHLLVGVPDQGFEDSDSSVFSTPSPKSKMRAQPPPPFFETQHASLKRKKIPEKPQVYSKHGAAGSLHCIKYTVKRDNRQFIWYTTKEKWGNTVSDRENLDANNFLFSNSSVAKKKQVSQWALCRAVALCCFVEKMLK